jgi:UDP-N-acetylglucosamine 2-epimerase (non-hydrolysing)
MKVLCIFGTRPEAIKMGPLVRELEASSSIESRVCITGQHREMLRQVIDIFGISIDYDLDVMRPKQSLYELTENVLGGLQSVLAQERPDIVLVHGDTTTSFASALAAFYQKIPVGHVEAGLRTYNKYSPFPEEINRSLISKIADIHFAPTGQNRENLQKEGIEKNVYVTGNTVIDAVKTIAEKDA